MFSICTPKISFSLNTAAQYTASSKLYKNDVKPDIYRGEIPGLFLYTDIQETRYHTLHYRKGEQPCCRYNI